MHIIADIGGTNMRIAGSRDLETFAEPVILPTPSQYQEGLARFIETARGVAGTDKIESVSIGIRGAIMPDKQGIAFDSHLTDWIGKMIAPDISSTLNAPVYIENDSALVGLGEALHGAGVGASIVVYITVSTGVGGVRIVDGKIEKAAIGFEIGGQYLSMGEHPETLEDLVSGAAIERKYGVHPRDLGGESPVWEELARITAFGVHNTILHWSPHRVVLGGSMFKEVGIAPERVDAHLKTIIKKFPSTPEIVRSSLDDLGGLWGAMAILKQNQTV